MKVNIIFERVPMGSFLNKTFNFVEESHKITWKKLFDFLEQKTMIPAIYLKLKCGGKMFTIDQNKNPFDFHSFSSTQSTATRGDYIIFSVDYNFDKIRKIREQKQYKIGILEASISSLKACGQTTTDLMMEMDALKSSFP